MRDSMRQESKKEYVEMRDVFEDRDTALDTLEKGKLFVSLREKNGYWCLTWLEERR